MLNLCHDAFPVRNLATAVLYAEFLPTLLPHPPDPFALGNEPFFEQPPPPQRSDVLPPLTLPHMFLLTSLVVPNPIFVTLPLEHAKPSRGLAV
jgi:hypothetical protein